MHLTDNVVVKTVSKRWMRIAIGVLAAILIVWDIPLAKDEISGNTWSELMRQAGTASIAVPWCCGLVMGHWFHPGDDLQPAIAPPLNAVVLLGLTVMVWLLGRTTDIALWIPLVVGAPVGAYLWPVSTNPMALHIIRKGGS